MTTKIFQCTFQQFIFSLLNMLTIRRVTWSVRAPTVDRSKHDSMERETVNLGLSHMASKTSSRSTYVKYVCMPTGYVSGKARMKARYRWNSTSTCTSNVWKQCDVTTRTHKILTASINIWYHEPLAPRATNPLSEDVPTNKQQPFFYSEQKAATAAKKEVRQNKEVGIIFIIQGRRYCVRTKSWRVYKSRTSKAVLYGWGVAPNIGRHWPGREIQSNLEEMCSTSTWMSSVLMVWQVRSNP